jgi:hypothetical protein
MAKIKNNIFMSGLSGTIGRQMTLSVKTYDTIAGKKRVPTNIPATAEQLEIRERFKAATRYALGVLLDPVRKALYAAEGKAAKKNQSAYNLAVKDAFSPPEIKSIFLTDYHGQPGNKISIDAFDVLTLASVHVGIYTAAEVLVEDGYAVLAPNEKTLWQYTATAQNPALQGSIIRVTAVDIPRNETAREVQIV